MSKTVGKRTRSVFLKIENLEKRENPAPIVPVYNSNPTAFAQLYLDFDGNTGPAGWCGTSGSITTSVFGTDGDSNNFSASELNIIDQTYKRMAEDYAPFNINVTTVLPSDFNNKHAIRLAIGNQSGGLNWSGVGGVGCVGSFYSGSSSDNIAFVHSPNLSNNAKNMALAGSQEVGHAFGMGYHQDSPPCGGYHPGGTYNGESKGPIMGAPWNSTREIWWKGFEGCGTNDDMAVISNTSNGFGYVADDEPDVFSLARRLRASGGTFVGDTSGIISKTSDIDIYAFVGPAGSASITVSAVSVGPNLDANMDLYQDVAGTPVLLASVDTAGNNFGGTINFSVPAGKKYIVIKSDGDFGEVGQYTISGTVPAGAAPGFGFDTGDLFNSVRHTGPDFSDSDNPMVVDNVGELIIDRFTGLANSSTTSLSTAVVENPRTAKATSLVVSSVASVRTPIASGLDAGIADQPEQQSSVSTSIVNTLVHRVGPSVLQLDAPILGDPLAHGA